MWFKIKEPAKKCVCQNLTLFSFPYRFYFDKLYNKDTKEFLDLPPNAEHYGTKKSGKGKGGKGKSSMKTENKEDEGHADTLGGLPKIEQPLKCLDVFAGCGGLSCGLHEAGIAESKWAIECYDAAAKSFKLNNRDTLVFNEDCNVLLKKAMEAEKNEKEDERTAIHNGQRLPRKGEVELLCGGPPCQGFSGMNRFNSGQYSSFKNSLISSYLSVIFFKIVLIILEGTIFYSENLEPNLLFSSHFDLPPANHKKTF